MQWCVNAGVTTTTLGDAEHLYFVHLTLITTHEKVGFDGFDRFDRFDFGDPEGDRRSAITRRVGIGFDPGFDPGQFVGETLAFWTL